MLVRDIISNLGFIILKEVDILLKNVNNEKDRDFLDIEKLYDRNFIGRSKKTIKTNIIIIYTIKSLK